MKKLIKPLLLFTMALSGINFIIALFGALFGESLAINAGTWKTVITVISVIVLILAIVLAIISVTVKKPKVNRNRRVYPESAVRDALSSPKIQEIMNSTQFMGEISHPETGDTIPVDPNVKVVAKIMTFDRPEPTRHLFKNLWKSIRRK